MLDVSIFAFAAFFGVDYFFLRRALGYLVLPQERKAKSKCSMLMDAEYEGVVKIFTHRHTDTQTHIWISFASHKAVSRSC